MLTHGGWLSGKKLFVNKIDALRHASENGLEMSYYFYDEVWEAASKKQINVDLDILYKERAMQLRDKYNYLILNYSAGADSHNILETFTKNQIRLDAVQIKWPVSYSSTRLAVYNTSPYNLLSEWELTILPSIRYIRKNFPDIKILIEDWSGTNEINLSDLEKFNQLLSLGDLFRFSTASAFEKKENTGIIWGIDKPLICQSDNKYGFFFRDTITSVGQSLFNENNEYFYWAIDFPELAVAQARVLVKHIIENKKDHLIFRKETTNQKDKIEHLRKLSIDILYSNKRNIFQVEKYQQENKQDWDSWLYSDAFYKPLVSCWNNEIQDILTNIDKKFCVVDNNQNKISLLPTNSKIFWLEQ